MIPKKLIFLLTVISFITLIPSSANALRDCSHLRAFSHEWNMCKITGSGSGSGSESKSETEVTMKKKKKITNILSNTWTKIKNVGGESIGGQD